MKKILFFVATSLFFFGISHSDNAEIYKKIDRSNFDLDKAINGLQERIRQYFKSTDNLEICRYLYKYKPTKYNLNKSERIEIAKNLIETMLTDR